jgi:hypothetical protein
MWAAGAAILALAVLIGFVTSGSERHQLASNLVRPLSFVTDIPPGGKACQVGENVPQGTGAVRFAIGTYGRPGPALTVRLRRKGGPVLEGRTSGGWNQGFVDVPLDRPADRAMGFRLCLENAGTGRITVGGENNPHSLKAFVDGRVTRGRMRVEYAEPEPASWWAFFPRLADRVAAVRNTAPGSLSLWLWVVLGTGVLTAAVVLVLREARQ